MLTMRTIPEVEISAVRSLLVLNVRGFNSFAR